MTQKNQEEYANLTILESDIIKDLTNLTDEEILHKVRSTLAKINSNKGESINFNIVLGIIILVVLLMLSGVISFGVTMLSFVLIALGEIAVSKFLGNDANPYFYALIIKTLNKNKINNLKKELALVREKKEKIRQSESNRELKVLNNIDKSQDLKALRMTLTERYDMLKSLKEKDNIPEEKALSRSRILK